MESLSMLLLLLSAVISGVHAQISGSNPVAGSCICVNFNNVNVRNGPCATVIGSANPPECYKSTGVKTTCALSGVNYDFFAVTYGATTGWMAGDFLVYGSSSQCESGGGSGVCANVEKVSRAEWGARPPSYAIGALPNKPVGMGFVHHTVGAFCTTKDACMAEMRAIQNYHMNTLGWPDIGYNWLVGEDGRAYEGRQWDKIGAHTYGYNDVAVAVSVMGDFTNRAPNAAAQSAVTNVFNCAIQQNVLRSNYEMFGHRDGSCTACPGNAFYPVIRTWPQYSFRSIPIYCSTEEEEEKHHEP